MGKYSLRALFDKEPAAIAGAVQVVLPVLVLLGIVHLTDDAMAGIVLVISTLLALFVRSSSTSKSSPTLTAGTEVAVQGSTDTVIIAKSPPGPVGVEGGQETPE